MQIFICCAQEALPIAEAISDALRPDRHQVVIGAKQVGIGPRLDNWSERAVKRADLFLCLVTPELMAPGRLSVAQIMLAADRWPDPGDAVLSVQLTPTPLEILPRYLQQLPMLAPAEDAVAATVDAVRRQRPRRGLARLWRR